MLARIISSIFPPRSERPKLVIVSRPNEMERELREQMERQKVDIYHGLGFDMSDDDQCWLRQAQLLRQYADDIEALKARVSALEGG